MKEFEDDDFRMYIHEGILYNIIKKDCVVTKEISANMIKQRLILSENSVYPVVVDGTKVKYWTTGSRNNHLQGHVYEFIEILGVVTKKRAITVLWEFSLRIFPLPVKHKLCSTVSEAEEWVRKESKILNS